MKTIILSIDALFSSDIDTMKKFEGFRRVFDNCIVVRDLEEIYPSLTYPSHASIITGCRPYLHGINHNTILAPHREHEDWYWYHNQIKCKTLFDYFYRHSISTASIYWPVTANAPVNYLIPEIWSQNADSTNIVRYSSSKILKSIIDRHCQYIEFDDKLIQDTFAAECAIDIINTYNPDVFFLHFCIVDKRRHQYGIYHNEVNRALELCSEWLEGIMDACESKNIGDEIVIMILGDHGQLNCSKAISMNSLFEQKGFLTSKDILNYKAFCHSAGISAQIYVRDDSIVGELELLFEELKEQNIILDYYSIDAARRLGLNGNFSYILEAAKDYSFSDDMLDEFIKRKSYMKGSNASGSHGHFPCRGDMPPLIVSSKRINDNKDISGYGLIDIAPTICEIYKMDYNKMDGQPISAITELFSDI